MEFEKLVRELQQGNRKAQQRLFDKHAKTMYGLCRRYLSPAEEAEEAMMTGFLKVFEQAGRSTFINEASLLAWMRKIMVNECLQVIRRSHSFLVLTDTLPEDNAAEESIQDSMGARELFGLMETLPTGYRTIFNLYVVEGYTHREIAELVGISEGASKSQLSKARGKLARLWTEKNAYYGLGKAGQ